MTDDESEYDLYWAAETELAYGVKEDIIDKTLIWLPKSQVEIEQNAQISDITTFLIPDWLAIEKGLV